MRLILISVLFAYFGEASANPSSCKDSLLLKKIEVSFAGNLTFLKTEVFRRNNSVGPQQMGQLVLKKWIELNESVGSSRNYIGIAGDGRIYQIIDLPGRTIARLLGGDKVFKDLMVFSDQILVAVDSDQMVQVYSPGKWGQSPLKGALKRGAALWFGTTLTAYTLLRFFSPESLSLSAHLGMLSIPLMSSFIGCSSGLSTFFAMLNRYDSGNTVTDGFIATGVNYSGVEALRQQLSGSTYDNYVAGTDFSAPATGVLPPKLPDELTESIR